MKLNKRKKHTEKQNILKIDCNSFFSNKKKNKHKIKLKNELLRKKTMSKIIEELKSDTEDVCKDTSLTLIQGRKIKLPFHKKFEINKNEKISKIEITKDVAFHKKKSKKEIKFEHKLIINKKKEKKLKNLLQVSQNEETVSIPETSLLPSQNEDSVDSRTLFFGNVPVDFNQKNFLKLIKSYGNVERMRIRGAKPSLTKIPKKIAVIKKMFHENHPSLVVYIVFQSAADAQNTLKLNGTMFEDHHLRVTLSTKKQQYDNNKGVFVGNLPYHVKDDEIWEMFKNCGEILNVRTVRDATTGVGKGFGYVNFESSDAVALALKLNDEKLNNREIRVEQLFTSKEKKTNEKKKKTKLKFGLKTSIPFTGKKNKNRHETSHFLKENIGIKNKKKKKTKTNTVEKKKKILAKKLATKSKKKEVFQI